jgi:hypothetical protein
LIGFYVTPTQYTSFGDVPALLVEEIVEITDIAEKAKAFKMRA